MVGGLVDVAALNLEYGSELRFSLEYVQDDGCLRREQLVECAAGRFEDVVPVRSFRWAKGAAHFPGFLVVVDHRGSRGLRIVAGTRSRHADGLRS
jgi:hypothetical protein